MLNARTSAWINQKGYTTFPYINHYIYPKSTQALCWMPGLQPGWTRKDTQHFPLLTMNEKLSMLHIPEVLRHCIECQDFSPTLTIIYIPKALRHYAECQDFSLGEQEKITTFPYIYHDRKTKYVIYPRNTQALHWMPWLPPGWTRKDTQHFPILTMTKKLSMLYIPEILRHFTECHDFSLGRLERIHNISLY